MLGVYEIAEKVGLTVGTVRVMSATGKLPEPDQFVNDGNTKLWKESTIDRWDKTRPRR